MKVIADLFAMAPGNKDHHPALRCALGVFVPLTTLVLMGRLDLAIFASFGAFTGIYGRGEPHGPRLVSQLRAGGLMLAVIVLGALTARTGPALGLDAGQHLWLVVAATTLVAGGCSVAISLWRIRPAGSLFHIFAFASIASITQQPPLWQGMLVAVLTVLLCLLIGFSSRVLPSRRTRWQLPPRIRHAAGERRTAWLEGAGYVVAAGLAGSLATLAGQHLGFGHNYWAMVAAVVPLVGHSTRHRISRGIQRILGTVVGLVVLAGVLLLHLEPWQTVLMMALCQFGVELFIIRQYLIAQIFVTPLALSATLLAGSAAPGILLRDRIVETVIGATVGIAVVLLPAVYARYTSRPVRHSAP